MGEVINLTDILKMKEALDAADIDRDDEPRMLLYRDNYGIPQVLVEGEHITQIQYDNMPQEIRDMIITEEKDGHTD